MLDRICPAKIAGIAVVLQEILAGRPIYSLDPETKEAVSYFVYALNQLDLLPERQERQLLTEASFAASRLRTLRALHLESALEHEQYHEWRNLLEHFGEQLIPDLQVTFGEALNDTPMQKAAILSAESWAASGWLAAHPVCGHA